MKEKDGFIRVTQFDKVFIDHIIYIEGVSNHSRIITNTKRVFISGSTLAKFEEALPDFVRCHKHALVNFSYVVKINQHTDKPWTLSLSTGEEVEVSRRRVNEVIRALHQRLGSK